MMRCNRDRSYPPFSVLNTVFMLNGIDLHDDTTLKGEWKKRVHVLRSVISTAFCWCTLIYNVYKPLIGDTLLEKATIALSLMRLFIQIEMTKNLRELKQFITTLCDELNERARFLLSLMSMVLFVMTFVISFLLNMVTKLPGTPETSVGYFIWLTCTLITCVLVVSMPLQCLSLILLYMHQRKRITLLYDLAKRGRGDLMFDTAHDMGKAFVTFEKLFSLHPLSWLFYSFLVTTYLLNLTFSGGPSVDSVSFIIFYYQQALNGLFILIILRVKEKISGHRSDIHFTLCMSTPDSYGEMCPSLSHALDEALSCNFTVYGMFNIDRSLVFSYITTVATFSVLTIQLQNGTLINTLCSC